MEFLNKLFNALKIRLFLFNLNVLSIVLFFIFFKKRFHIDLSESIVDVIGSGPSLEIEDIEKSKNLGISSNRIYKLFLKTNWRPKYYFFQDYACYKSISDDTEFKKLLMSNQIFVFSHHFLIDPYLRKRKNTFFYILMPPPFKISKNFMWIMRDGRSVTLSILNFLRFGNAKKINLFGIDNYYTGKDDYFDKSIDNEGINKPRPNEVSKNLTSIFNELNLNGFKVVNSSKRSKLKI